MTKSVGRRVGQHAELVAERLLTAVRMSDRALDGRNPGWSFRHGCFRNCFSLFSSATELAPKETWLFGDLADDLRGGIPRGAGSAGGERGERQS